MTTTRLVVSVHDVAPVTDLATRRWLKDADAFGIPVSLLVIPGPWRGTALADEPGYADVLRERVARGDELMTHGWTHRAGPEGSFARRSIGRAVARGAAEFAALDEAEARERLLAGRAVLRDLGLTANGFTPPGWLASPGTGRALRDLRFTHTTSHLGVHDLRTGHRWRGFALSHRPGGAGERLGAAVLGGRARRGGLVRIALHPGDLERPGLRDVTLRAIEAVLTAGGRAMTYAELVAR